MPFSSSLMNIAVTGYAGYEGSRIIYNSETCRDKLLRRYSESFFGVFKETKAAQPPISGETEENGLDRMFRRLNGEGYAADASEGGVLAALWNVLKQNRSGGEYSLRAIPVLQQTIEVCEMFNLNPYRLHAPRCRVWLVSDMAALQHEAAGAGEPLSVIGFTTKGAAIRRTDTEGDSSLRRPEEDELHRLIF